VKNAPDENLPAMVVAKLLQFIKALSARKWTDQEIVEDLSFLQDELQASFDQLTYSPPSPHVSPKIHKKTPLTGSGPSMSIPPSLNRDIYRGHPLIAAMISGVKMPLN
jgi:V-ATPase subunit H